MLFKTLPSWALFSQILILLSIVKDIDKISLDHKDLCSRQILLFGYTSLDMLILSHRFLTQPSTSLYHSRDLKNHFLNFQFFLQRSHYILPEFILYPFCLHADIFRGLCLVVVVFFFFFFELSQWCPKLFMTPRDCILSYIVCENCCIFIYINIYVYNIYVLNI